MNGSATSVRVKRSAIGKSGRVRICKSAFEEASLSSGDLVIIEYGSKTILVEGYTDVLVEDGYVRLRWNDLKRLGVLEEDEVALQPYQPLGKAIKRGIKQHF